ncbi:MAG: cell division protein FtsX [Flavobacteriales bacterium]|nr:cell division protein FtsX [Flavobacteriales bacterium]|tara:strand:- start:242 stop:1120 length:879 start_codon:yes stop_codon:yes gene_type:complete
MTLVTEKFFKHRLLNSKISVFLATTFSVLIMGLLGIIAINYNALGDTLKENISFNLFLNDNLQELETQQLIKSLSLVSGIKSVNFISKTESAQTLTDNIGEDFLEIIGENPLKNIIEIKYYASYLTKFNSKDKIKQFMSYDEIDDVLYDQDIIFLLENNLKKIGIFFLIISVFFFLIAFILINSNIRLTIYSKRFIIKTMQLVGATKRFIQKPFLVNNIFLSVLACFVGNLILILVLILLIDKIPEMKSFISLNQLIYLTIITSFLNLGISFFSTLICVRKYLNLKTDDLYK